MKLRLAAASLAILLLSACGNSHSSSSDSNQKQAGRQTAAVEESAKHYDEAADKATTNTLESTMDELSPVPDEQSEQAIEQEIELEAKLNMWTTEELEGVPLSKKEFNQLLTEMIEEDDEANPFREITLLDEQTLKVVFNNSDGDSLENMLIAPIFDGVLRNLYMSSTYYQNEQQPIIQFVDSSGELIAENRNFANKEQP